MSRKMYLKLYQKDRYAFQKLVEAGDTRFSTLEEYRMSLGREIKKPKQQKDNLIFELVQKLQIAKQQEMEVKNQLKRLLAV